MQILYDRTEGLYLKYEKGEEAETLEFLEWLRLHSDDEDKIDAIIDQVLKGNRYDA